MRKRQIYISGRIFWLVGQQKKDEKKEKTHGDGTKAIIMCFFS